MEETDPTTAADPKTKKPATGSDAGRRTDPEALEGSSTLSEDSAPYAGTPDSMSEAPPSGAEDRPGDDAEPDPTVPRENDAAGGSGEDARPGAAGSDGDEDKDEVQPEDPGSMLGIAPRAEAIVSEREMSPQEKAILQDLEESMDPEDRDNGEEPTPDPASGVADTGPSASAQDAKVESGNLAAPVAMAAAETKPKKKSILPWWAAVLLYGGAGAFAIYTGMEETRQVMKFLFIGLGLYLLYGAYEAIRDRAKGSDEAPPAAT